MGNSPRFQQSTAMGLDFAGQEVADLGEPVLLLGGEELFESVEVAVRVGKVMGVCSRSGHGCLPGIVCRSPNEGPVSYWSVTYRRSGGEEREAGSQQTSRSAGNHVPAGAANRG